MSSDFLYSEIAKMCLELNDLIVKRNFNLRSNEVLEYSQKLDKLISLYVKKVNAINRKKID